MPCGPRDVISPEEDGLLVPPGDTDALARAIIRLMERPELRSRMGEAARNKAARYAMDPVCSRVDGPLPSIKLFFITLTFIFIKTCRSFPSSFPATT